IQLPPLRERRDDVPLLVAHFLGRFNGRHGTSFVVPCAEAIRPLVEHEWPGNVRELENTIEAFCIVADANSVSFEEILAQQSVVEQPWADERPRLVRIREAHRWNRQRAAAALGISRVTLWRRMERHGIRDPLASPGG